MTTDDGDRRVTSTFLPRFTIRGWMAAVALIALAWGAMGFVNRMHFEAAHRAAYAMLHESQTREGLRRRGVIQVAETPFTAYHRKMADKWRNAAKHPWVPVKPDPPEPPP